MSHFYDISKKAQLEGWKTSEWNSQASKGETN